MSEQPDARPVLRFAPSPTGELHIGHALSAVTTWRWAERLGGRFLVRIEDIDTGRARAHFIEQIFEDLGWLGLAWEAPVLRQSEHFPDYEACAEKLTSLGLLYPCFATRSEIREEVARLDALGRGVAHDPDGSPLYPGLHKALTPDEVAARQARGEPRALRLDMAAALARVRDLTGRSEITYTALDESGHARDVIADPARWGDAVIVRKYIPASYHLAVVVDDHRQGVTHVTRGQDLEAATDLHRLLQVLLGFDAPSYHHHRLLTDAEGKKLAKSGGAESLRSLRDKGLTRQDILARIGFS
jgi:glutamyl-Q tRNA(Asp) synthetase